MKFDIVWEYCIQEQSREALLREYDQALSIHTKGRKQSKFKKGSHKTSKNKFQKKKKDYSKYQCYNYQKIGHLAKRHHTHLAEYEDEEEIPQKRLTKEEDVLFSALSRFVTPGEDTWLIYSGA